MGKCVMSSHYWCEFSNFQVSYYFLIGKIACEIYRGALGLVTEQKSLDLYKKQLSRLRYELHNIGKHCSDEQFFFDLSRIIFAEQENDYVFDVLIVYQKIFDKFLGISKLDIVNLNIPKKAKKSLIKNLIVLIFDYMKIVKEDKIFLYYSYVVRNLFDACTYIFKHDVPDYRIHKIMRIIDLFEEKYSASEEILVTQCHSNTLRLLSDGYENELFIESLNKPFLKLNHWISYKILELCGVDERGVDDIFNDKKAKRVLFEIAEVVLKNHICAFGQKTYVKNVGGSQKDFEDVARGILLRVISRYFFDSRYKIKMAYDMEQIYVKKFFKLSKDCINREIKGFLESECKINTSFVDVFKNMMLKICRFLFFKRSVRQEDKNIFKDVV